MENEPEASFNTEADEPTVSAITECVYEYTSPFTPFREFLATRPLDQVNLLIAQVGKMRGEPLYLKAPQFSRTKDGVYTETYSSGGDTVNLFVQTEKSKHDDAKMEFPRVKDELEYAVSQMGKVNREIERGEMGRLEDLAKFESQAIELRAKLNDLQRLIDNPKIERFAFKLDECR